MTKKLALQWLPCQAPCVERLVLGLVGPVLVYHGEGGGDSGGSVCDIFVHNRLLSHRRDCRIPSRHVCRNESNPLVSKDLIQIDCSHTPLPHYLLVHLSIGLLLACLPCQQNASISQGRTCSDNCTWCDTEIEVSDQTFYLNQSQYTDTRPTSPSTDPITPGAWQGSHWITYC